MNPIDYKKCTEGMSHKEKFIILKYSRRVNKLLKKGANENVESINENVLEEAKKSFSSKHQKVIERFNDKLEQQVEK